MVDLFAILSPAPVMWGCFVLLSWQLDQAVIPAAGNAIFEVVENE
jgi:hypothetical protein